MATRAGSSGGDGCGERIPVVEAASRSRPVVKARGPAPERTMARVEGVCERWVKRERSSCHMLGEGLVGKEEGLGGGLTAR